MIKRITVFCGSRTGQDPLYAEQAWRLGKLMADKKIGLVYGGGNKGLMGVIANAVMEAGGSVTGVIPKVLLQWEAQHEGITELLIVEDMHERKKMLYELGDAAIILPGGNGTLDELFEMLTWNTLQIHNKKIAIINAGGYYDHLVAHINTMADQGFLYDNWQERLLVCETAETAITSLTSV
ncbi:MAG TPA: TIGR00730 family Rossman fold protein [Sediminibacterium sp.]|nr:TIGR00730 family Rossman fold protein [Sediminibacterium sp.]